jgi:hypothetical protein
MIEYLPAAMSIFGALLGKSGADDAAEATRNQAALSRRAAEFTAVQLEQRGGQAIAVSQRQARAGDLQTDLITSRQLAVAAASGGGASDPTIQNLIAKTSATGAVRRAMDLYAGEEQNRQLRLQAAAARYSGDLGIQAGNAKASAYETQGNASLLAGAGGLFAKYGMGGANKVVPGDTSGDNWF